MITKKTAHDENREAIKKTSDDSNLTALGFNNKAAPFGRRVNCWVCLRLCGDRFFNSDASREIDRLTFENETLRAASKR